MGIPLNQALSVGAYVIGQHLRGNKRYPLVLMLEPLFRCNLACAGCGKIDYPDKILNQRISVADALHSMDECGAPVVVLAGGEPLLHKELPEIVEGALKKGKFVTVVHERTAAWRRRSISISRTKTSTGRSISMATRRCTTGRSARRASTIVPSKRSRSRSRRASVSTSTRRCFSDAKAEQVAKFLDEMKKLDIGRSHDFARLRLRTRAGPAALPQSDEDEAALPRHLQARQGWQGVAVLPVGALPRLPCRQSDVSVHAVGQPDAYRVWLAEALLSPRRRLHQDLQRADGRHGLGQVRHRQLREVRGLHGALCFEATAVMDAVKKPWKIAAVALRGREDRRADGARNRARQAASGGIRVLTACREQASRDQRLRGRAQKPVAAE